MKQDNINGTVRRSPLRSDLLGNKMKSDEEYRPILEVINEIKTEINDYCQNHHSTPLDHAIMLILSARSKLKQIRNLSNELKRTAAP